MSMKKEYDLKILSRPLEISLIIVWPLLLIITWFLFLGLARSSGVFRDIPLHFRQGIKRIDVSSIPGFLQDPFFTIWQFFWIPCVLAAAYALRMIPRMIKHFTDTAVSDPSSVKIPGEMTNLMEWFKRQIFLKWQWYIAVVAGLIAILMQIRTQVGRIHSMDIMYWWDWRINKTIFILRLLMVGVDIFFALILLFRSAWAVAFIKKYLGLLKLTPRPFHPDKAGGLGLIGKVCISFTWPMLIVGIMLATSFMLHEEASYLFTNILTLILYIISITFIFFFPLSSVHKIMKNSKEIWLDRISQQISKLLIKIEDSLNKGEEAASLFLGNMKHLKEYYTLVEELPVWPYDIGTLSRFISSIFIPVGMIVVQMLIESVLK